MKSMLYAGSMPTSYVSDCVCACACGEQPAPTCCMYKLVLTTYEIMVYRA